MSREPIHCTHYALDSWKCSVQRAKRDGNNEIYMAYADIVLRMYAHTPDNFL